MQILYDLETVSELLYVHLLRKSPRKAYLMPVHRQGMTFYSSE